MGAKVDYDFDENWAKEMQQLLADSEQALNESINHRFKVFASIFALDCNITVLKNYGTMIHSITKWIKMLDERKTAKLKKDLKAQYKRVEKGMLEEVFPELKDQVNWLKENEPEVFEKWLSETKNAKDYLENLKLI